MLMQKKTRKYSGKLFFLKKHVKDKWTSAPGFILRTENLKSNHTNHAKK